MNTAGRASPLGRLGASAAVGVAADSSELGDSEGNTIVCCQCAVQTQKQNSQREWHGEGAKMTL